MVVHVTNEKYSMLNFLVQMRSHSLHELCLSLLQVATGAILKLPANFL